MAEFSVVMKQAKRMCDAQEDCEVCPLGKKLDCVCVLSDAAVMMDADKIEHIVMNWAANHPEAVYPTWREWQEANFPNADSIIRPCVFESENYFNCVNKVGCELCENERIPADIAEKLGIKPIGGVSDEHA